MKAVLLTAGAAGMYCGSCMHDNSLARGLRDRGVDCLLQPVYTPIRTDEPSLASAQVFFGGIHIYLLQQLPWLRWVPSPLRRLLDWPPLIRLATRRVNSTDPATLGRLTISMLQGDHGRQRDEVVRLVEWLRTDVRPDAIVLSNLLIGGALPAIRRALPNTRVIVMLQGDDIFLDHLPSDARAEAIRLCSQLSTHVDRFVTNSHFYAEKMSSLLGIDRGKFELLPLSIDTRPYQDHAVQVPALDEGATQPFRLGYLARIAPEKGLHRLVDAFLDLTARPGNDAVRLEVAGWLGPANEPYLRLLVDRIEAAGLGDRFSYHGSPDLAGKLDFLHRLDVLSVPTEYEEPKGLFVLEALAAGVPVIQPDHGAFGELIASTGGGRLVPPENTAALVEAIEQCRQDRASTRSLGLAGQRQVWERHSIETAADRLQTIMTATVFDEQPAVANPETLSGLHGEASVRAR